MNTGDLVVHLARFGEALRGQGVALAAADPVDALQALLQVDLGDCREVQLALRCALRIRPVDGPTFDEVFARMWMGRGAGQPQPGQPPLDVRPGRPRPGGALPQRDGAPAGVEREVEVPEGEEPGESREARLRRKHFEACSEADLARMEGLLARLARQLATRRSRRLRPTLSRGRFDPRRSLRRALSTGGEMLQLARRGRPVETARLVFLCDTSGSMEAHTRFLLAFARAIRRVAPSTEVFVFNVELTRVTDWLDAPRQEVALARLSAGVRDWSGGTRIGESLQAFCQRHLDSLVDSRTVVLVFSDGLDRGEPGLIAAAMRRISARARRIVWLNPLLSDPRYEPTALGMAAALPFIDQLAPAHDLASLERLLPELRA